LVSPDAAQRWGDQSRYRISDDEIKSALPLVRPLSRASRRRRPGRGASVPRSHRRCRPEARRLSLAGFSFALAGRGDLLALPFWPSLPRCDRFHRPRKSSGPPLFAPSLKVQGDDTHNNSGLFGDLTPSIAEQLPGAVRMARGTTVFRIRIEPIFHRCWNLITPWRSAQRRRESAAALVRYQ
jgi:hypothetical protein